MLVVEHGETKADTVPSASSSAPILVAARSESGASALAGPSAKSDVR